MTRWAEAGIIPTAVFDPKDSLYSKISLDVVTFEPGISESRLRINDAIRSLWTL